MADSPMFDEVARGHSTPVAEPVFAAEPEPVYAPPPEPVDVSEPEPAAELVAAAEPAPVNEPEPEPAPEPPAPVPAPEPVAAAAPAPVIDPPVPAAPDVDEIDARAAKLAELMETRRAPVPEPDPAPAPHVDDVDARAAKLAELMETRRAQRQTHEAEAEPQRPVSVPTDPVPAPVDVAVPAAPQVAEEPAVEPPPPAEPDPAAAALSVAEPQQVQAPVPRRYEPANPPPQRPAPATEWSPPPPPAPASAPPVWGAMPPPPPPPGWRPLPPPPPPPGWPAGTPPWPVMPPPPPGSRPPAAHASGNEPAFNVEYDSDEVRQPRHSAPPDYCPPQGYRVPTSLDEAEVFNRARHAPQSGWRRTLHKATGGRVNPGDSRKNREMEELLEQIRQPINGDFRIAVLSIKGGVGKTTTTLGLGSALAMVRTDRVIAVDANPDRGTLAERVRDFSTQSTVRDLLRDPNISRYADVRTHTRMASSRLEVLASEQDPAVAEVFGEEDYRHTMGILRHHYNVILTDCGTGIMHSAMSGVLDLAHAIVLVSSPAIDAARSASATLDWLTQHGHGGLVREAHVVLSASRPGSAALKMDKVYEHFEARCQSIHMIPFDQHLAEGADIDFGLLKPATMQAYIELAGAVSEKFSRLRVSYDGR